MADTLSPLVETSWLADHLDDPDLRIIDVRWKFREVDGRGVGYDDIAEFHAGHIPGAVFVGMASELADPDQSVPDMMLPAEAFAAVMRRLGVSNDTHVVVYDDSGLPLAAARLWWALTRYGHERVQVLNGGLQQWTLEGRPVSQQAVEVPAGSFQARPRPEWVASKADVLAAIDDPDTKIVDFLPNDLFRGEGTHAWGGRSGHVPTACNIPAISNIDPAMAMTPIAERAAKMKERGSFRLGEEKDLMAHYRGKGLDPDGPVIAYCGRGIAASCGMLTMRHLGFQNIRLYDGSWAEWSADESLPVETG